MDDVTVTFTGMEARRLFTVLHAMVTAQEIQSVAGMKSAQRLDPFVGEVRSGIEKLAEAAGINVEAFGDPEALATAVGIVAGRIDAKSYEDTEIDEHTAVSDLPDDLTPEQSAELFATEYDESIRALRTTLYEYTSYSDEDFMKMLDEIRELLETTTTYQTGMSIAGSMPYVKISDLATLGRLAHEAYGRQEEMIVNEAARNGA